MKVILKQDVNALGEEGDICKVANGFARNYLFPKNMAMPYNKHNLHLIEQRKAAIEKRKEEKRKEALGLKEKLENEELVFQMPAGESGKLFGSITNTMIADELTKKGYTNIEKKRIEIPDHHIKMLGSFTVRLRLYGNEEAKINLSVTPVEKK